MKTIHFATTNDRKMIEAVAGCKKFNIKVEQVILDIEEIQSNHPENIGIDKVNKAFTRVQKPVVVTDTSWNIPALNGFPGGYMKDVANWFNSEDFLNLMKGKDRKIAFTESIFYKDTKQVKHFSREFWGEITDKPRGKNGNSIERIAAFDGKTIAENRDEGKLSHDPKDYIWIDFAKWYSEL
jgi:XTP/dITP diphosphohydrolase